jgi:hypothetical protein
MVLILGYYILCLCVRNSVSILDSSSMAIYHKVYSHSISYLMHCQAVKSSGAVCSLRQIRSSGGASKINNVLECLQCSWN